MTAPKRMRSTKAPMMSARDDGEGHLEHEEHAFRQRRARRHRIARNADEEYLAEVADIGAAGVEGETIGAGKPGHGNEAGDGETLHQHREQVLGAHEPAIEQGKPRQSHE
jgi:hypothetical protein